MAETEVEWIGEEGGVAGSVVEDDWEGVGGWDACCGGVERELADLEDVLVKVGGWKGMSDLQEYRHR